MIRRAAAGTVSHRTVPLTVRATIGLLWTIAMLLIAAMAIVCALSAYACLSSLVIGQWYAAGGLAGLSAVTAIAALLLCRYRGDLVGDTFRM